MTLTITHPYVVVGAEAGNGEVNKARWNAALNYSGTLEIAKGGTDATTAQLAARNLSFPFLFAQTATPATIGAVTTETVLATITIPAGAMGPNGILVLDVFWTTNNNANAKNLFVRVGGVAGTQVVGMANAGQASNIRRMFMVNNNSQTSQKYMMPAGRIDGYGSASSASITSAVDTSAAWDLVISGTKANSADTITLEGYQVQIFYGA